MPIVAEYLDALMFACLVGSILLGYPVALTVGGVAILFAGIGWLAGVFDAALLGALGQRVFGVMTNNVLIAIPMFVFMGVMLEKSRVAEDLLEKMGALFGGMRGGLGVSVMAVGALLAASTGIVGATVVAMGVIALPTLLRNGYSRRLASGAVCTAGTLGQIIPPSTLLIILSAVMSNSYQQAQFEQGKFSVESISVGQVFAAALLPGLALVAIYILYILGRARVLPAPAAAAPWVERTVWVGALQSVVPPVLLIIAVLGSILGGVATPSEAASVGAVGALLLACAKQPGTRRIVILGALALGALAILVQLHPARLQREDAGMTDYASGAVAILLVVVAAAAIFRSLSRMWRDGILVSTLTSTMVITSMIFATILTASFFALIFRGLGGDAHVEEIISAMPGGAQGALLFVMAMIFVLGFFLDFVEISVIILPLVATPLILMGHDPLWLSMLIALNLQTSFLTPPFGFSLFYLRGVAPPEVSTGDIYIGVAPFIALNLVGIAVVWLFQPVATWLPGAIFG